MIIFFCIPALRGEVIYPHNNRPEIGLEALDEPSHTSNRKFSDLSSTTIPELHHHLQGRRAGWISTWNPHVELGRPSWHVNGLSSAFVLTHALSWMSDNAFRVYTVLALAAVLLTGIFGFRFLEALGLGPAACLLGAVSWSLGVFTAYWLTFVMFLWGVCWTLGLLWMVARFLQRATLARGVAIAFFVHALLLTAYPQQAIWHAYLLTAFTSLEIARRFRGSFQRFSAAAKLLPPVLLGIASAAPVYLDLMVSAEQSLRIDAAGEFFLKSLPQPQSVQDLLIGLSQLVDAFWLGNPISAEYPIAFNGICLTPLLCQLVLCSALGGLPKKLWFWQIFMAVCFLLTYWPAGYLWSVEHLGLSVSRWTPLNSAFIPAVVIAASSADHLLSNGSGRRLGMFLAFVPAALVFAAAGLRPDQADPLRVIIAAAVAASGVVFIARPGRRVIVALAIVTAFLYGGRLVLFRPLDSIAVTSPLVEELLRNTRDGSRFASLINQAVPPNQEALLGVRSIHTYDSLAPARYQQLFRPMNAARDLNYGRHFRAIDSPLNVDAELLREAAVGLFVSRNPLAIPANLAALKGTAGPFWLYELQRRPLRQAQVASFSISRSGNAEFRRSGAEAGRPIALARVTDLDNLLRFQLHATKEPTLLFVSLQHHPQWQAYGAGGQLETVLVHDFFLGVQIPPHTTEVELRFEPYAWWSWVPQAAFAVAVLGLTAWNIRQAPRSARELER